MPLNLDAVKEKAGPLPVWGWALVVVGIFYYYSKKKAASATSNSALATSATSGTPTADDYSGALLAADYAQLNAMGLQTSAINADTSQDVILNSNLSANTGAVNANTFADKHETDPIVRRPIPMPIPKTKVNPVPPRVMPKAPPSTPARPRSNVYVVVPGDNLSSIAARFKTTWQAIYAANKGVVGGNPNLIHPGQKLVIP